MIFERLQRQTHQVNTSQFEVSYDRLTTRFNIVSGEKLLYSKLLLFWPFHKARFEFQTSQPNNKVQYYEVRIFWFIFWSAKLYSYSPVPLAVDPSSAKEAQLSSTIVVPELLEIRRRKSIGMLIYSSVMSAIRFVLHMAT